MEMGPFALLLLLSVDALMLAPPSGCSLLDEGPAVVECPPSTSPRKLAPLGTCSILHVLLVRSRFGVREKKPFCDFLPVFWVRKNALNFFSQIWLCRRKIIKTGWGCVDRSSGNSWFAYQAWTIYSNTHAGLPWLPPQSPVPIRQSPPLRRRSSWRRRTSRRRT